MARPHERQPSASANNHLRFVNVPARNPSTAEIIDHQFAKISANRRDQIILDVLSLKVDG
jgi:hypothetical protein